MKRREDAERNYAEHLQRHDERIWGESRKRNEESRKLEEATGEPSRRWTNFEDPSRKPKPRPMPPSNFKSKYEQGSTNYSNNVKQSDVKFPFTFPDGVTVNNNEEFRAHFRKRSKDIRAKNKNKE